MKHCFGIIAQNDHRYTVHMHKEKGDGASTTGNLSGYNADVFKDSPADMPVIDYRTADADAVFNYIVGAESPIEIGDVYYKPRPTLDEYLAGAEAIGATIRTAKEFQMVNA